MRKESLLSKIVGWAIAVPIVGTLTYLGLSELVKDDYGGRVEKPAEERTVEGNGRLTFSEFELIKHPEIKIPNRNLTARTEDFPSTKTNPTKTPYTKPKQAEEPKAEKRIDTELKKSPKTDEDYENLIEQIIQIESSGNPNAYNKRTKATGLMQITPVVVEEFNENNSNTKYSLRDMKNPEKNRRVGTWYLRRLGEHYFEKYSIKPTNDHLAGAYNAGVNRLRDNIRFGIPLPMETRNYQGRIN
jgi:hypothetical protein